MSLQNIPDIEPFIANDKSAVRFYLVFALCIASIGLVIGNIGFLPSFQTANEWRDLAQKLGGLFISSLSAFPLKEYLARRDRLKILSAINERIDLFKLQEEPSEEERSRLTELIWELYKKGATG
jgi:hypothetical protein